MSRLRSAVASLAALSLTATLAGSVLAQDDSEASEEPPLPGVYSIEDMTWLLTAQMIDGERVEVPDRVTITLFMQGGQAGGSAGCNSYFATYELDGFDLSFGEIGSTMMACLGPVMEQEQAYLANLAHVTAYQSGGIQMALLDADGEFLLEFDLAPPESVVGSWVATGINNGNEAVETTDITPEVTAQFSPDGDLTGFDGCNNYFTTYVVEDDTITIDPAIGQTMMACPSEEHAQQSGAYLAALVNATTWSMGTSGNLELRDADGALQVSYAQAE